jgi:arginine exporter protein ArgO
MEEILSNPLVLIGLAVIGLFMLSKAIVMVKLIVVGVGAAVLLGYISMSEVEETAEKWANSDLVEDTLEAVHEVDVKAAAKLVVDTLQE